LNLSGRHNGLLIRIDSSATEFPNICPICGERATHHRLVSKSNRRRLKAQRSTYYRPTRYTKKNVVQGETRRLRIPVCDEHYCTSEEMSRMNLLSGLIAGISVLLFGLVGAIIAFHYYDNIPLPIGAYLIFLTIIIVMLGSFRNLGPDELQKVISIVDFHHHGHIIILRIKDNWYGEEILRSNPSSAQGVRFRNG